MGFGFPLLSDPEHVAGVLLEAERAPDDPGYGLPLRITYLVDPQGVIRRSYRPKREDYAAHAAEVAADLMAETAAS